MIENPAPHLPGIDLRYFLNTPHVSVAVYIRYFTIIHFLISFSSVNTIKNEPTQSIEEQSYVKHC